MGVPRVSLAALNDLHRLLVTYGFERSSADDVTVVQEEQDEAVSTKPARTPTAPGAQSRQASGDEPEHERSKALVLLAQLLLEAASAATGEHADDRV